MYATCTARLILPGLITVTLLGKDSKLLSYTLRNFFHVRVTTASSKTLVCVLLEYGAKFRILYVVYNVYGVNVADMTMKYCIPIGFQPVEFQ
jgi:hypothetical protein